jgi:predicted TIM-barrel fold metal-dependent hydrolase
MASTQKPFVIALEEHYWDSELLSHFSGRDAKRIPAIEKRLEDLGELRLSEMDEAGIDVQVLSHGAPGAQKLPVDIAVRVARETNDRLAEVVRTHPTRFAAFAALPTPDPKGGADELERTVSKLGFKGAMIHGLTAGRLFVDDRRFWPIFERAQALDVPLYIHPAFPHPAVIEAYYQDYVARFPELLGPALGFTVEAKTQAIRLILSGVFDAYPGLRIILGHLGETLPFVLWRVDQALSRPGNSGLAFKDTFRRHFYVTTSGNFSDSALLCSVMELGIDRILFSVDWPFASNTDAMRWMEKVPLCSEDKEKIFGGNARRLLRM